MSDKKNNDYEKPQSQEMGGDDLEGVSGGAEAEAGPCKSGFSAQGRACGEGSQPTGCEHGSYFGTGDCIGGGQPSGSCRSGRVL